MKQFDYVITLKHPDFKRINLISLLMIFFANAMFFYTALNNNSIIKFNLIAIGLITARLLYTVIFSLKKDYISSFSAALFLCAGAWFFQPKWNIFFAVLYVTAAFLEKQAKFPLEIGVDKNGIVFNSFPKKRSVWNELNNVLIKDNVLTVDYKNNKLYQKDIEENVSDETEREFNEFCRKNLTN